MLKKDKSDMYLYIDINTRLLEPIHVLLGKGGIHPGQPHFVELEDF